jgi:hypothetical protein
VLSAHVSLALLGWEIKMSHGAVGAAVGTGLILAGLIATSNPTRAEEAHVLVNVDPSKQTTITIKPFAAELAKKAITPAPAYLKNKPLTSCTASVTYNNGAVDADCSIDF